MNILEDRRSELISKGRSGAKEKSDNRSRFEKRIKSRVASNVRNYNKIDMNKLFKQGILDINIEVHGETDDYIVGISFGGFLDELHRQLRNAALFDLRSVIRALINSFNGDNVYLRCNCGDFRFRQAYWMSRNDIILGEKENRPSNITNPHNTLGPGCKHIMLVLSNQNWIMKVASVIVNYVKYMEKHYQKMYSDIIYPAIYEKKYEEPVQLGMFDTDELVDKEQSQPDVDVANIEARRRGRFTSGNPYRFTSRPNPAQQSLDVDSQEVEDGK